MDWCQDVFGNVVATAVFAQSTRELTISATATVEQAGSPWPVFRIAPSAHLYPFQYTTDEILDMGAFMRSPSPTVVSKWARGFLPSGETDTLSLLKNINAAVLDHVSYRTREEEGTQSAEETLSVGSGSCRDIAELFIASVRQLGFGARAVSGYLYDPNASLHDPGATHAWAEVYLPDAGWIAFDPTRRSLGEANLVPVAVARQNSQIMPISGSYSGDNDALSGMNASGRVTSIT